jgi:hypothetical protein
VACHASLSAHTLAGAQAHRGPACQIFGVPVSVCGTLYGGLALVSEAGPGGGRGRAPGRARGAVLVSALTVPVGVSSGPGRAAACTGTASRVRVSRHSRELAELRDLTFLTVS